MNALRHGAYAEALTLLLEAPEDLQALRNGLAEALAPVGSLEIALVERIVSLWWRIRRARQAGDQALWMAARRNVSNPFLSFSGTPGLMAEAEALDADECRLAEAWDPDRQDRLLRHEMTLDRAFFRTLHELERMQARRKGQPLPPPLAVDLTLEGAED
jgi:hypothetical protein